MMYTVGHTKSYEQYFNEQERPQKLGRGLMWNGEYTTGGSIWLERDDAVAYLDAHAIKDYSVYGVLCHNHQVDWVIPGYGYLLVTSELVKL